MNRFVKAGLATLGGALGLGVLALALLAGLGFYLQSKGLVPARTAAGPSTPTPASGAPAPVAAPRTTPATGASIANGASGALIARLETFVSAGRYADLGVHVLNNAHTMTNHERLAAIAWLDGRRGWGRSPVLFLLARLHEANGDFDSAMSLFLAGSLCYRIDAQCVIDETARSAPVLVESHLDTLRKSLVDRPDRQAASARVALEIEECLKDREPAWWIAAHGLGAMGKPQASGSPAASAFIDGAEREAIRARMRATFAKSLKVDLSASAPEPAHEKTPATGQ